MSNPKTTRTPGTSGTAARLATAPKREPFHDSRTGAAVRGVPAPKPCPFCSCDYIEISVVRANPETGDTGSAIAECTSCGAQGPSAGSSLDAARAWNSRPGEGDRAASEALSPAHQAAWDAVGTFAPHARRQ